MYVTTTAIADDDTRSGGEGCYGELEKQSAGAVQAENTSAGQQHMDSYSNPTIVMIVVVWGIEVVATYCRGHVHFSFVIVALTTPALHIYYHHDHDDTCS